MNTPRRFVPNNRDNMQEINIPASPFMKNLGYGTGVTVFRLERSPKCGQIQSPWAIKRVSHHKRKDGGEIINTRLKVEAEILRKLSHPNIVGFRGVTKATDGVDSLALECCNTSLGSILEDNYENKLGPLSAKSTLKMIFDISNALHYLHTVARLLHGDIKSFNILVKGDFEICKLCDFGVSLPLDENGVIEFNKNPNLHYIGTNLWSAPEVIDDEDIIDCKADIFSFGLVIYETIALVPPHTLESFDSAENLELNNSQDDLIKNCDLPYGTRPPLPDVFELNKDYNCIIELFYCCTNELPEDRPYAQTIVKSLKEKFESDEKLIDKC